MNRDVKFRGFGKEKNSWVYGYCFEDTDGKYYIKPKEISVVFSYEVVPESVGQFTGLTDKNGVEIYFDDLYIDEDGDVFKVMQMECGRYALERWNDGYVDEFIDWKCVEIIGNLFQNSELLKQ